MKGTNLNILSRICLCLALLAAGDGSAVAAPFFSAPIKATVVDGDTGRPLEGVMVVATWDSSFSVPLVTLGYSENGGSSVTLCDARVNLLTAVSGKDGVFQIPGWGPKGGCLAMGSYEPLLVLYKPGFQPLQISNLDAGTDTTSDKVVLLKSISKWDGKTIKLVRSGPHRTIPDPQMDSLNHYMGMLPNGNCFWDEARPAYLLAMQEERRLSSYGYDSRFVEKSIGSESNLRTTPKLPGMALCKLPKGYLEGLVAEADQSRPEIRTPQFLRGSPEDVFEQSNPDPWAMPAEDLPQGDDLAPGGAAEVAIIHHVNLQYPDKPYFARIYTSLPLDPKIVSDFPQHATSSGWESPVCAEFHAPAPEGLDARYLYVPPPGLDKNGKAPEGYPVCYMLTLLGAPDGSMGRQAKDNPNSEYYTRRATYDATTLTYVITEQLLNRQPGVKVPEYIEIETPSGAHISTDLTPTANPRRWLLPGFTRERLAPSVAPIQSSLSPLAAYQTDQPRLTSKFKLVVTMPRIAGRAASTQAVPQPYEGSTSTSYGGTQQMLMVPAAATH